MFGDCVGVSYSISERNQNGLRTRLNKGRWKEDSEGE